MSPNEVTLLLVDDDASNLDSLETIFQKEGYRVVRAANVREALDAARGHAVQVVLTDLLMPDGTGIELLRALQTVAPDAEVVVMTAFGTVETAVEAMKDGAYDFVEKPLKRRAIVKAIEKAVERAGLVRENKALRAELQAYRGRRQPIGQSPAFRRTMEIALQAAPSTATVLALGESGTGKELLARVLHDHSARAQGAFVAVNCAAIPETIIEGELFGYERGAFTGAVARREGRFAAANGGTLFLDEVGELTPAVQVKLLRALQEGEIEPLGGKTTRVDVRVVAATNKDLAREVAAGRFRQDLYYRLNVIAITLPPLRARHDDIPLLADLFLRHYAAKNAKVVTGIAPAALQHLLDYPWPGNVRELENAIERAVVLCKGSVVGADDLPRSIVEERGPAGEIVVTVGTPLDEIEHRVIRETLRLTRGDKKAAAQLLGIATRTIYRKLAETPPAELGDETHGES